MSEYKSFHICCKWPHWEGGVKKSLQSKHWPAFTPPDTWPMAVQSGHGCLFWKISAIPPEFSVWKRVSDGVRPSNKWVESKLRQLYSNIVFRLGQFLSISLDLEITLRNSVWCRSVMSGQCLIFQCNKIRTGADTSDRDLWNVIDPSDTIGKLLQIPSMFDMDRTCTRQGCSARK